jgi:hypothetical protein
MVVGIEGIGEGRIGEWIALRYTVGTAVLSLLVKALEEAGSV